LRAGRTVSTGRTLIALVALLALRTLSTLRSLRTHRTLRSLLTAGRAAEHTIAQRQGGRDDDALSRPSRGGGATDESTCILFENDVVVVVREDAFLNYLADLIAMQSVDQPDERISRRLRRKLCCSILNHEATHVRT
jgi:hypothetical protein